MNQTNKDAMQQQPDSSEMSLNSSAPSQNQKFTAPVGTGEQATGHSDSAERQKPQRAPLFREEAVQGQEKRLNGDILLTHTLTFRSFALFYTGLFFLITAFLCFGSYTRKAPVVGYLEPESGLTKVYPASSGKITELLVKEGDVVERGAPLAKVVVDNISGGGYGFQKIAEELNRSVNTLLQERAKADKNYKVEENLLHLELDYNRGLITSLMRQKEQIENKQHLLNEKLDSIKVLKDSNFASTAEFNNEKINTYDIALALSRIDVSINEARHKIHLSELQLKKLPISHEVRLGEIEQRISELRSRIADANMRHGYTIVAPTDGRIAALTFKSGDSISPNYPILNIVPAWSKMQAKIYLPASGISFVQEGQDISIQYQALPVQRFGTFPGKIIHISSIPINPNDFKDSPLSFNQPMYVLTAEVYDQNIDLDGQNFPIVPGMAVKVSLLAEKQTILEWLLEPVWEVKDRF